MPAAGPEVEDPLAFAEIGDGRRVAAAERREDRGVGQLGALQGGVQLRADRLRVAGAAAARIRLASPQRRTGCGPRRGSTPSSCVGAPQQLAGARWRARLTRSRRVGWQQDWWQAAARTRRSRARVVLAFALAKRDEVGWNDHERLSSSVCGAVSRY